MKRKAIQTLALLTGILVLFSATALAGTIAQRQKKQSRRIVQGIASGELTQKEANSLARQQKNIEKARKKAWKDGTLTKAEKKKITAMQNRASDKIALKKHNARKQR